MDIIRQVANSNTAVRKITQQGEVLAIAVCLMLVTLLSIFGQNVLQEPVDQTIEMTAENEVATAPVVSTITEEKEQEDSANSQIQEVKLEVTTSEIENYTTTESGDSQNQADINVEEPKAEINVSDVQMRKVVPENLSDRGTIRDDKKTLVDIAEPDLSYKGTVIKLSDSDRDFLEHLVMAEAGGEDYIGMALVAQAIRDAMVSDGLTVKEVWRDFKYTSKMSRKPSEDVKRAVEYIFDEGNSAVQHRIMYFYAPKMVKSRWHETQHFVIEHKGHRMFDRVEG